jgi:membrane-associated phospholipid phosphatase
MRRAARTILCVATLAAGLAFPEVAHADPATVEWSEAWPRVRWWEVVDSFVLAVGDDQFENRVPLPSHASWNSPILFDTAARNLLRGRTLAVQSTASTTADILWKGGALVPFVVDDFFGALSLHQNVDVAWQLAVIDLQSFGVAGLVSLGFEHSVGRARPYTESCVNGKVLDAQGHVLETCGGPNDDRSFYSGHATSAATAAGLVCLHHQHLPLFGGGIADLVPCVLMIGVAATAGVLRVVYDQHWASDVMVGWADGVLSGYVLPTLLHFGPRGRRPLGEVQVGSMHMAPTLLARPGGTELGMIGVF